MDDNVKRIKVFVASPGDVSDERNQLPNVVREINTILTAIVPNEKIVIDLLRWETDTFPNAGQPQAVVDDQIRDYDIFIGIMWKRFGTPTDKAGSGTEQEFNNAYEKWKENKTLPVMFYFSQGASSPPKTIEEIDQLKKVTEFKMKLSNIALVSEYNEQKTFSDQVRPHLIMAIGKIMALSKSKTTTVQRPKELITESDMLLVKTQLNKLTSEYETIRATMEAGDARTRKMSLVESKMRAMAFSILPLLDELINSQSPGNRLAAIAALKEMPDDNYLLWLSERIGKAEASFVGYNASLALLIAAREAKDDNKKKVKKAIDNALENLNNSQYKDPNQEYILYEALNEFE